LFSGDLEVITLSECQTCACMSRVWKPHCNFAWEW